MPGDRSEDARAVEEELKELQAESEWLEARILNREASFEEHERDEAIYFRINDLEKRLAMARGQTYADGLALFAPEPGSSANPKLVATEFQVLLFYRAASIEAAGSEIIDLGGKTEDLIALCRFYNCFFHQFRHIVDDEIELSPLWNAGLKGRQFVEVHNSTLTLDVCENLKRGEISTDHLGSLRHFLLYFHDSLFECVSSGISQSLFRGRFSQAMSHAMALE